MPKDGKPTEIKTSLDAFWECWDIRRQLANLELFENTVSIFLHQNDDVFQYTTTQIDDDIRNDEKI